MFYFNLLFLTFATKTLSPMEIQQISLRFWSSEVSVAPILDLPHAMVLLLSPGTRRSQSLNSSRNVLYKECQKYKLTC